jgi:drug/metabolite transporter (DMT)-like permease
MVRIYLLLAVLGVFPGQVFMTWGTRLSLASNAATINLTLPVATAIFAVVFLRERMTGVRWASFPMAIVGVLLGSAFYNSYGKNALKWRSPTKMLFYTYVAACALVAPVVFLEERSVFARIPQFTAQTWIGLIPLTVFHNYPIAFFGVPIAALFLGERLTAHAVAGGVLVLAGTLPITVWEEIRPFRKPERCP